MTKWWICPKCGNSYDFELLNQRFNSLSIIEVLKCKCCGHVFEVRFF